MVLKRALTGLIGAMLVLWSAASVAEEYRPHEFLRLDLSKAVLSPKRIGPPAAFAPEAVEASAEPATTAAQVRLEPTHRSDKARADIVIANRRVATHRAEKPRGAGRTRLARRHGNPLDAQAFDARIQVWPCKSGGICNWKRQVE